MTTHAGAVVIHNTSGFDCNIQTWSCWHKFREKYKASYVWKSKNVKCFVQLWRYFHKSQNYCILMRRNPSTAWQNDFPFFLIQTKRAKPVHREEYCMQNLKNVVQNLCEVPEITVWRLINDNKFGNEKKYGDVMWIWADQTTEGGSSSLFLVFDLTDCWFIQMV